MYGHRKHIWADMQRQKKKSKAPEDNKELTRTATSKSVAKINATKKKLLKKAGRNSGKRWSPYSKPA